MFKNLNITRISTLFVITFLFTTSAYAENCNLKNLDFGINQEKLKKNYTLDLPDVATEGEENIISGAAEICKDMPEKSIIEFTMIDDKFVQMRIVHEGTGTLLKYANNIFGEMDNAEKDQKKLKPGRKTKLGLWSKDNDYNVTYTTHIAGKKNFEKLIITSKKYKNLFDKANETKSKAAIDYLKEKRTGMGASTDGNGATKPTTIQDNYKADKKNILKDNDDSRGYHYE